MEYRYDYLRTAEEQLRALRFVDAYLGKISRQMRPFSVMVADTLTVSSANKVEKPIYHVGFRTLVLARSKTSPSRIRSMHRLPKSSTAW